MGRRLVRSRRVIVAPVVVGNKFFCGVLDADPGAGARRREMLLVEVLLLVSLRQKRYVAVALIDHSGGENQLGVAFASENARKACPVFEGVRMGEGRGGGGESGCVGEYPMNAARLHRGSS